MEPALCFVTTGCSTTDREVYSGIAKHAQVKSVELDEQGPPVVHFRDLAGRIFRIVHPEDGDNDVPPRRLEWDQELWDEKQRRHFMVRESVASAEEGCVAQDFRLQRKDQEMQRAHLSRVPKLHRLKKQLQPCDAFCDRFVERVFDEQDNDRLRRLQEEMVERTWKRFVEASSPNSAFLKPPQSASCLQCHITLRKDVSPFLVASVLQIATLFVFPFVVVWMRPLSA